MERKWIAYRGRGKFNSRKKQRKEDRKKYQMNKNYRIKYRETSCRRSIYL